MTEWRLISGYDAWYFYDGWACEVELEGLKNGQQDQQSKGEAWYVWFDEDEIEQVKKKKLSWKDIEYIIRSSLKDNKSEVTIYFSFSKKKLEL